MSKQKQAGEISFDEARAMLPDKPILQIKRGATRQLKEEEWSRERIVGLLEQCPCIGLSGHVASSMGFGICIMYGQEYLFIQTRKEGE